MNVKKSISYFNKCIGCNSNFQFTYLFVVSNLIFLWIIYFLSWFPFLAAYQDEKQQSDNFIHCNGMMACSPFLDKACRVPLGRAGNLCISEQLYGYTPSNSYSPCLVLTLRLVRTLNFFLSKVWYLWNISVFNILMHSGDSIKSRKVLSNKSMSFILDFINKNYYFYLI